MLFLNHSFDMDRSVFKDSMPQILMNSLTLYAVIFHFVRILLFLRSMLKCTLITSHRLLDS